VNSPIVHGQNQVPVRVYFEEILSRRRYELIDEVFHPVGLAHFGSRIIRREEGMAEMKAWRVAAPDHRATIDEIAENGDMVQVAWTIRGTHTGPGFTVKPTGKLVVVRGKSRFRVQNGKIVESWSDEYRPELLRQLGVSGSKTFMFLLTLSLWSTIKIVISGLTSWHFFG